MLICINQQANCIQILPKVNPVCGISHFSTTRLPPISPTVFSFDMLIGA